MNVVWVVSGGDVVVAALSLVWGVVWMPRAWAAGVEERKAKGAVVVVVSVLLEVSVAEVVELRVSRFGSVEEEEEEEEGGLRRDFRRAIWASLRVFSAIRAAWRVRVSRSLRRRV